VTRALLASRAVPGSRTSTRTGAAALLCAAAVAGCGEQERQDADEPAGSYEVEVVEADFPERQRLARSERLVLEVRNAGGQAVPDLAATVTGLGTRDEEADPSGQERPVWVVDDAPAGAATAYAGTWALGRLEPGERRRFVWRVTAVRPGVHAVRWRVAAGLDGRARAVTAQGQTPEGRFDVRVARRPAVSRVDPETGEVVRAPASGAH
jgi:hypothetical protein